MNKKVKPLSETERGAVLDLNRQAVAAFLDRMSGVEELCCQSLSLSAPDGLEHPRDLAGAAESLQTLGRFYMARSDYSRALDNFQKSLRLFEQSGQRREIALSRSYLGAAFSNLGDYSRAAEILRQALLEAEAIPDDGLSAEILNDLSYTYVLAGQPMLALNHLQRSIRIFRDLRDDMRLSWALDSLGQAYLMEGRREEALACILEGLELTNRLKFWRDVARCKHGAGEMYREVGELAKALEMFQGELELAREYALQGDECSALFSIADLYQAEGRFEESLPLLERAVKLARETGIKPHLSRCCLLLSRAYKNLGDYKHALEYHERFHEVDKEIFNTEADQRLRNVQVLYQLETAQKEAELYQLRAEALELEVEERRRTEGVLAHMASTDPLTDLLNRRAFFDLAEKAFAAAAREEAALSMILIDIDHFKMVNDRFGHLVGDQVLAQVAERMRSSLRVSDKIARYGGEEFIVLLPEVNPVWALAMADRLRQAVAGEPLMARGVAVSITLSLGVAGLEPGKSFDSLDQLIAEADQALYRAKENGRNIACTL